MPLLVWEAPAIVVASESVQQWLLQVELPRLQQWLDVSKSVQIITPNSTPVEFSGLSFVTPQLWLQDQLKSQKILPAGILTLIDGVDDLDGWVQEVLSLKIYGHDWDQLMLSHPGFRETIRDLRIRITHSLFQHPANPYNCHVLEDDDRLPIYEVLSQLQQYSPLTKSWTELLNHLTPRSQIASNRESLSAHTNDLGLLSAQVDRQSGTFTLQHSPIRLASLLRRIWQQQPTVLIGSALDLDASADTYRQTHGLDDLTCIKFSPPRQES
jgi:ATP-dependent DNA helicase DinG